MGRVAMPWQRGKHIAFTGIDGAGKSTQAGKLAYYVCERYGRAYLAESRSDFVSKTMHTLAGHHGMGRREYYGDHVVDFAKAFEVVLNHYTTIEPLLVAGTHVIEPRSIYCRTMMALAMSGLRDAKTEEVLDLIPKPDLLFWIDIDPQVALERVKKRAIDTETLHDLQCFSDAFKDTADTYEWLRVPGNGTEIRVFETIRGHARKLFKSDLR